jgi:hypothetical protein
MVGEVNEGGGPDRDEDIGPQPRAALPVLALGADQRAKQERNQQADERIDEIEQLECVQESHRNAPGIARDHRPAFGAGYSHRH